MLRHGDACCCVADFDMPSTIAPSKAKPDPVGYVRGLQEKVREGGQQQNPRRRRQGQLFVEGLAEMTATAVPCVTPAAHAATRVCHHSRGCGGIATRILPLCLLKTGLLRLHCAHAGVWYGRRLHSRAYVCQCGCTLHCFNRL